MNRIDSQLNGNRHQQRRQNNQCCCTIHKHSQQNEEYINDQQEYDFFIYIKFLKLLVNNFAKRIII